MIAAGMDHDLYAFSALPARAPFALPDGARVAVCPVVHLDDWTLDPPDGAWSDPRFTDPHGRFAPDYRTMTWRDYGLRIGIFRLFETFDRHGLTATLAVGQAVADGCPRLIDEALSRGWEIAAHARHANEMLTSEMAPDAERKLIRDCLDTLESRTGRRPTGWVGQDYGQSAETPRLLAEEGVLWMADWPNDEQPYLIRTDPPILSIPMLSELDDVELLWHRRVATPRYPELVAEAHAVLHRDGARGARVMGLGLHPWLFGMPHRIRYLDAALAALASAPDTWHTTLGALADWSLGRLRQGDTP